MKSALTNLLLALVILAFMPAALAAPAQEADDSYSEEQRLLFGTPHLRNIRSTASLHYNFRQSGSQAQSIEDSVVLKITGLSASGGKNVETGFFSDANNRTYAVEDFRGNPLLMFFLEWDVTKMGRNSEISRHHFRRLLRRAFLTAAQSEKVTFTHGGRRVQGYKVFFQPLAGARDDARYKNYPAKYYEFVLADDIPGGIYSIATRVPGASPKDEVLEYTEVKFSRVDPQAAFSGQGADGKH